MRLFYLLICIGLVACGDDDGPVDASPDASTDSAVVDVGADSDTDAGSDSGLDSSVIDAAMDVTTMWPDAGGLAPPEWVDLTIGPPGSCVDIVACGGNVEGSWDVMGGCFELDAESELSRCPGAAVTRREGRARGRVVFGGDGVAHRVVEAVVEADVFFPAICAVVFSCEMLEAAMAAVATEASCGPTPIGSGCDCTVRLVTTIDDRDAYRIEGNEIVGSGKRWEYCIEGDTLNYWDTSPSGPREPGIVELGRR